MEAGMMVICQGGSSGGRYFDTVSLTHSYDKRAQMHDRSERRFFKLDYYPYIKVVSAALLNSPVSTLWVSVSSNALVLSNNFLVNGL
jgi:hypothetical protein